MLIIFFCRDQDIMMKWKKLLDKLEDRKNTLSGFNSLMTIFRETESIQEELKEAEVTLSIDSFFTIFFVLENFCKNHWLVNDTVKPVYKGHSMEPEYVALRVVVLYIQVKIICTIH